jgi:hypothetical protein
VRIEILVSEGREKWWEISVNNLHLRVLLSLTLAIHRQNPCTVTSAKKSVGRQPNKMKKNRRGFDKQLTRAYAPSPPHFGVALLSPTDRRVPVICRFDGGESPGREERERNPRERQDETRVRLCGFSFVFFLCCES